MNRKQMFLIAGIGLVASGVAAILVIYSTIYGLSPFDTMVYQPLSARNDSSRFNLQEIHASSGIVMHDHAFLVLVRNGQQEEVPKDIGMPGGIWHDQSLNRYGPSGLSPMHTHDNSGTIHIESTSMREFTFGEFLQVWGIDTGSIVRVTDSSGNEIEDYQNSVLSEGAILRMEISE